MRLLIDPIANNPVSNTISDLGSIYPEGELISLAGQLVQGFGNVHGGSTTTESALTQAENYLGPGYAEIAPGVFRSADGARHFRMTSSDLTDPFKAPTFILKQ